MYCEDSHLGEVHSGYQPTSYARGSGFPDTGNTLILTEDTNTPSRPPDDPPPVLSDLSDANIWSLLFQVPPPLSPDRMISEIIWSR